jgi:hypothetical protein
MGTAIMRERRLLDIALPDEPIKDVRTINNYIYIGKG